MVYDFKYDGGGMGKGGIGTIKANGNKIAESRIEKTQPGVLWIRGLSQLETLLLY